MVSPGLGHLAVMDMEDVDGVDLELPARAFGAGRMERDDVLVIADHIVLPSSTPAHAGPAAVLVCSVDLRGHDGAMDLVHVNRIEQGACVLANEPVSQREQLVADT